MSRTRSRSDDRPKSARGRGHETQPEGAAGEQIAAFRQAHGYPPFGRLVRFVYSSTDERRCWREAGRLRRQLHDRLDALIGTDLRLIGPAPCYVERLRGRYRWQLVACGNGIDELVDGLVLQPGWIVDVDPLSLL